jgi:hypothetical protein
MKPRLVRPVLAGILAGIACSGVAVWGLRAVFADGIPTTNPLSYSGTLTEGGQLVNAPRQLTVNLWSNGSPQTGEVALCSTNVASTPVINGRFRVALDASCKSEINAHPDAYVEVVVGGTTSVGRAKIGAVPYAVEADHAVRATQAAGAASFAVTGDLMVAGASTFSGPVNVGGRASFGSGSGLATSTPIPYGGSVLPRSGTFSSSGGVLLVLASASAFNQAAGGTMHVDVTLDGNVVGALQGFTNEASSHKALTSNPIVLTGIAAGKHTVALSLAKGDTDGNDYSAVTVVELPL